LRTDFLTLPTLSFLKVEAMLRINPIAMWDSERRREINRCPIGQSHIEFTGHLHRADLFTFLTGGTFLWVDIPGIMFHADFKIAHKPLHPFHLTLGEGMNQGMLLNFLQFRG
jgi:hypothetical protein